MTNVVVVLEDIEITVIEVIEDTFQFHIALQVHKVSILSKLIFQIFFYVVCKSYQGTVGYDLGYKKIFIINICSLKRIESLLSN